MAADRRCRNRILRAPVQVASTDPIKPKAHDTPATTVIDTQKQLARIMATAIQVRVGLEQTRPLFLAVERCSWDSVDGFRRQRRDS
jgi:hypothetical protein